MRRVLVLALLLLSAPPAVPPAAAYPLDGYPRTGIARLEAYRLAREILLARGRLAPGSLLPLAEVDIRLAGQPDVELPEPDEELGRRLRELLGADASGFAVALLDLSDPAAPRYAELHGDRSQNPGSIGKVLVALGWFRALAERFPDDPEKRRLLLRETEVEADAFIVRDEHKVPVWAPGDPVVRMRPLEIGDLGNLYTYLDWMLSSSSNAAASVLQKELLLFRHFGAAYPVSAERAERFFRETARAALGRDLRDALEGAVAAVGLDPRKLRQGSFFTRTGKQRVPGVSSHATARELVRLMLRMEEGRLVDAWSSRELKRLLYLTDRRVRYASAPVLDRHAVYFKSGSLYRCRPEPGFACGKYRGNVLNYLNSIAVVETRDRTPRLHYLVAVLSNVLRRDAVALHRDLASGIHALVASLHPEVPVPGAVEEASSERAGGRAP